MNETKHTPGPWIAKHWQPGHHRSMVLTVDAGGATTIATMGWINGEANANLIAAAPDLYAALATMLEAFQVTTPKNKAEAVANINARRIARAAIAKAEGNAAKPSRVQPGEPDPRD